MIFDSKTSAFQAAPTDLEGYGRYYSTGNQSAFVAHNKVVALVDCCLGSKSDGRFLEYNFEENEVKILSTLTYPP